MSVVTIGSAHDAGSLMLHRALQSWPLLKRSSTNMVTIRLPARVCRTIHRACARAGVRETGGMLFAEHVANDEFRVLEATVAGTGSIAAFFRSVAEGLRRLEKFFDRTKHDYRRFNYLGEWHSHPSFALVPSATDDDTMFEIVTDQSTGARFAVSLIVKVEAGRLYSAAYSYFPPHQRAVSSVVVEPDTDDTERRHSN